MKKALFWPINLLVLGTFVWAIGHFWGFERLLLPWRQVSVTLIAMVIVAQAASYSLRALRVYQAEPMIPKGAWGRCLQLILLNNALNLLLPARTGEASFPLLLQRWFGVGLAKGSGTLLWLRLLDLNILAVLCLLCLMPVLLPAYKLVWWFLAALVAVGVWLGLIVQAPARRWLTGRGGKAAGVALQLLEGLPGSAQQIAIDLLLTWAAWGIKLSLLAAVFAVLSGLSMNTALLGAIGGDLSTVLPLHTPGGFGTYEAGVMALIAPASSPSPLLLAAAVNLHLLVLGIALAGGALAWLGQPRVVKSPQ